MQLDEYDHRQQQHDRWQHEKGRQMPPPVERLAEPRQHGGEAGRGEAATVLWSGLRWDLASVRGQLRILNIGGCARVYVTSAAALVRCARSPPRGLHAAAHR